MRDVKIK